MNRWDYKVRTYGFVGGEEKFMLETVHQGEHSKDMEVEVALSLNRRVEVTNLRTGERTKFNP